MGNCSQLIKCLHNQLTADIYVATGRVPDNQLTERTLTMSYDTEYKKVELRKVKQGDLFKRKPSALSFFVRNHYNKKDFFGPANFTCTNWDNGNEVFLKPSTVVFVEV